ncbi:hypothetical protein QS460_04405 [Liquorilactobacillus mali]|uniref:hypothetical protein n=1 Tax=Liquorilactobacillus mali TaxID=1618 RepID=UPI002653B0F0|nr:hypothetical protein [Liquorilactobacillus mali]MDN7145167.1 hypothetical protein [Liquorilactobacillus mali]
MKNPEISIDGAVNGFNRSNQHAYLFINLKTAKVEYREIFNDNHVNLKKPNVLLLEKFPNDTVTVNEIEVLSKSTEIVKKYGKEN